MRLRFLTVDVFTDCLFGGNQLAVLPRAEGLPPERMQRIAREFNLSETVFVLPPENRAHTRRLRIFTPAAEMPFAGHPTVGTAFVLAAIGEIPLAGERTELVFEEGVGPVPVMVQADAGRPTFSQLTAAKAPETGPAPPPADRLAAAFSLNPEDLLEAGHAGAEWRSKVAWTPEAWSCGAPFLFVPVRDRRALARAEVDLARWRPLLSTYWAPQVFLFCPDPEREGSDFRARMFGPGLGITEDPATGSAVAALAGYLAPRRAVRDGLVQLVIEQGFEMGRPSLLDLEFDLSGGAAVSVRVGGSSVLVSDGTMET